MTKQTGGPAFPTVENWKHDSGMTLRDYFAAKAMQAIIAHSQWNDDTVRCAALDAYAFADAMLTEREK